MRLIPICQEIASPSGRRSKAGSQGSLDGFPQNARSFLRGADRWEVGHSKPASGSVGNGPVKVFSPATGLIAQMQAQACSEALPDKSGRSPTGWSSKGEPQAFPADRFEEQMSR
jgi:hypothetical protein